MNVKLVCEFVLMVCSVRSLHGAARVKRQFFPQPVEFGEDVGEPGGWNPFGGMFGAYPTATNVGALGRLSALTNNAVPPAPAAQQDDTLRRQFLANMALAILGEGSPPLQTNPTNPAAPIVPVNPLAQARQGRRWWGERGERGERRESFRRRFGANRTPADVGTGVPSAGTNSAFPAPQGNQMTPPVSRGRWGEGGNNFRRRYWFNGRPGEVGGPNNPPVNQPLQMNPAIPVDRNFRGASGFPGNFAGQSAPIATGQVQLAALNAPEPVVASRASSVLVVM